MRLWLIIAAILVLLPWHEGAAQSSSKKAEIATPEALKLLDAGKVKEILKSDLILLENAKRYKLDAIRIPSLFAGEATTELESLLIGKMAGAYSGRAEWEMTDRFQVPLAHVVNQDGVWLQSHLVEKGLAWVYASSANQPLMQKLLKKEAAAREEKKGLWSSPAYDIKTPENAHQFINSFQVIEGKVVAVASKIDFFFVNFGKDWKTDFSLMIKRENFGDFGGKYPEHNINTWTGKRVRVRGWIEESHGPMIDLTNKDQIEILPDEAKAE